MVRIPLVVLLFVLLALVPARSARSNLSIEIQGSSMVDITKREVTFTVYNNRPRVVDMDLNGDFVFDSADMGILLGSYQQHGAADLGRLLGAWGSAWHRQDLAAAPDYGWYYIVPAGLNPVVSLDPDGVTTYLSWGQTNSFRTVREVGNLKDGLQITLESHERRTYFIKMVMR